MARIRQRDRQVASARGRPSSTSRVIVGSFEDAICATTVEPRHRSVVLAEGFPYHSRHDAPVLRSVLDPLGEADSADMSALRLARALRRVRPELDIYLLSDRHVEKIAGDPQRDARAARLLRGRGAAGDCISPS